MNIVVDVNIVLSALIRDSSTRKLILESGHTLYFPEASVTKLIKYKNYVIEKAGISEQEYLSVIRTLFKHITIVPRDKIKKYWDKAKEIMAQTDPEDVVFIAAALSLEDSFVWSEDKDFELQSKVKVLKTKDVVRLFY